MITVRTQVDCSYTVLYIILLYITTELYLATLNIVDNNTRARVGHRGRPGYSLKAYLGNFAGRHKFSISAAVPTPIVVGPHPDSEPKPTPI